LSVTDTRRTVNEADLRESVAAQYRGGLRRYARVKLRRDPVYAAAAAHVDGIAAPVLDIGCGIGLLGLYLRARGFRDRYVGIDCDHSKVSEARRCGAAQDPALTFATADAAALPAFRGTVVLLDILHYLHGDQQQELLRAAASRTAAGAVLIIRTALREPTWRYVATVCEERVLYGVGWMQMPARHFPRQNEIESALHHAGLETHTRPLWGDTPFASFLIVARRPG
jgi:2-polyprenyl-3-methyl-5-hydroxy-6-metoxy-1,4-benzoquinol methylase